MNLTKFNYKYEPPSQENYYFGFNENANIIFEIRQYDKNKIIVANEDYVNPENSIFSDEERNNFKENMNKIVPILKLCNVDKIFESLSFLIKQKIKFGPNLENEINILELEKGNKSSIQNILIYLIKNYSLKENTKDCLNDFIKVFYSYRKIELYFYPNENIPKNLKLFMNNISYIISFISICLSPLDLLEYEYIDRKDLNNNISQLNSEFEICFKNVQENEQLTQNIIYYQKKIFLHQENDKFDQLDFDIRNIKIEQPQNIKKELDELPDFSNEIASILDKIQKNEINVSNLLKFLNDCKKYIIKIPLIFQQKNNDLKISSITGCQKIYNYIISLKESPICKTKFELSIFNYIEEIENFLSQFSCFKTKINKLEQKEAQLTFIERCQIPYDYQKSIEIEKNEEAKDKIIKDLSSQANLIVEEIDISNKEKLEKYKSKKFFDGNIKNQNNEHKNKEKIKIYIKEEMIKDLIDNYQNPKTLQAQRYLNNDDLNNNKYNNRTEIDVNKIRKNQNNSCSASWILERYMSIISKKNQKFSIISNDNEIKDVIVPFDEINSKENIDLIKIYKSASFLFQNLISNLIRENVITYSKNNLKAKTLEKVILI